MNNRVQRLGKEAKGSYMSGCYPADVTGNELHFNPDYTAECKSKSCGVTFDTDQSAFDNRLCNDCGNDLEARITKIETEMGIEIEWKVRS